MHISDLEFKDYIQEQRKQSGLSQYDFGAKLGVSWITIWRWENGVTEPGELTKKGIYNILT